MDIQSRTPFIENLHFISPASRLFPQVSLAGEAPTWVGMTKDSHLACCSPGLLLASATMGGSCPHPDQSWDWLAAQRHADLWVEASPILTLFHHWWRKSWELKEALRSWYAKATEATAEAELDAWIAQVQQDGPPALRKTFSAFRDWRKEILAFFPLRISNGFVEGKNNRTKTIMRQEYGFSNREHLRWRILFGEIS